MRRISQRSSGLLKSKASGEGEELRATIVAAEVDVRPLDDDQWCPKTPSPSESNWHCRVESGISAPRVEQFGWVICPSGYFVSSARTKNISLPHLVETSL